MSIAELLGEQPKLGKRGPAPKLQQQLQQLQSLPRAKQRLVSEVLDSLLAQPGRWQPQREPQQRQGPLMRAFRFVRWDE